MIQAVIVDDEIASIDSLEILLNHCEQEVNIAGKASNIDDARVIIQQTTPDVVFLDVEMPNGSGFELLDSFDHFDFEVVFITAYNQYAIKAFKYAAIDYILKPVDISTLCHAIQRVIQNKKENTQKKLSLLQESIHNEHPQRIALANQDFLEIVNTEDIIQFEAEGSYTKVYIQNSSPVIVSKSVKDYEDLLASNIFFRCHKSHLINFNHIKKVVKNQNYVEMVDNSRAYISRRKKPEFFEAINNFLAQ